MSTATPGIDFLRRQMQRMQDRTSRLETTHAALLAVAKAAEDYLTQPHSREDSERLLDQLRVTIAAAEGGEG